MSVEDVVSGYGLPAEEAPRIDPDAYVFRDAADSDRPVGTRYRHAVYDRQSVAVGCNDCTFYGLRQEDDPRVYPAVVEHRHGDGITAVGILHELYDELGAEGRERLRSDAINAVEEIAGVPETQQEDFCDLVLENREP